MLYVTAVTASGNGFILFPEAKPNPTSQNDPLSTLLPDFRRHFSAYCTGRRIIMKACLAPDFIPKVMRQGWFSPRPSGYKGSQKWYSCPFLAWGKPVFRQKLSLS